MDKDRINESIENINNQLNERANQLLSADPAARELIVLKKGLELCAGELSPIMEPNGNIAEEPEVIGAV